MNFITTLLIVTLIAILCGIGLIAVMRQAWLYRDWTRVRRLRFLLVWLLGMTAIILATEARAEVFQPNFYVNALTNGTEIVTNAQSKAVTTKPFTVRQGKGFTLFPYVDGTNATSANYILRCETTYDGTNWTTTGPLRFTNALTSSTAVRHSFVVPASTLDNVRQVKISHLINEHTNSIAFSNAVFSVSNQ
jgi:hypothetical protein